MEKAKRKVSASSAVIVVLCALLLLAFTSMGTMAWFASKDSASSTLKMGGRVDIALNPDYDPDTQTGGLQFTVDQTIGMLPGMWVPVNVEARLKESTTRAFLRASIEVSGLASTDGGTEEDIYNQFYNEISRLANLNGFYRVAGLKASDKDGNGVALPTEPDNDNYFYYTGVGGDTAEKGAKTPLVAVGADAATTDINILGDGTSLEDLNTKTNRKAANCLKIPTEWTNAAAMKTLTITVIIEAIQSTIPIDPANPQSENATEIGQAQYAFEAAQKQANVELDVINPKA